MILRRTCAIVLSAALFTLGAGASVTAQGKRDTARGEALLIKEVRHELLLLPYYGVFDWLEYKVQGDAVTLQGQVTRPSLKSDAENVMKKLESVARVSNQIEVLPVSIGDDRIRRAVYLTLFRQDSPLFRYSLGADPSIHIIVKNGHVTLKGQVDSESDKSVAGIKTNGIGGIFSVTNQLTVRGK